MCVYIRIYDYICIFVSTFKNKTTYRNKQYKPYPESETPPNRSLKLWGFDSWVLMKPMGRKAREKLLRWSIQFSELVLG